MKSRKWKKPEINFVIKEHRKGHGRKSIAKLFKDKFGYERSESSIKHCLDTHALDIERALPKVLVIDIESKPIISETWGIYDQNINIEDIIEDWSILSFSAKWLGDPKIIYKDQRGKKRSQLYNDKELVKQIRDLLDEADAVLGQNVKAFDLPKITSKIIEHELEAPSHFKVLDTVLMARKHGFTSKKLAFLTSKLNKRYKKLDHGKFPGKKLWKECMNGNLAAWKEMENYNKHDILSTEELFTILAKYENSQLINDAMRVLDKKQNKR